MADHPDRPGYSFDRTPPAEASRFLRNKGIRPSFSFQDVEPEEHAVAFTVAKAMQTDVLEAIRGEAQLALDEGRTLAQFRRDLRPKLEKLGWWGRTEMVDPNTGEPVPVQLGSPRRLRTIYRSNLRSARAAGQWDRIQRTKRALPYLLYQLGPSERHRPHHADKEGLVLPVDDPFWLEWFTPNGWGCKCWLRQISRAEADRRGISQAPAVESRPWRNPRTGEIRQVPVGIDPAWVGNPGAARLARMEEMLEARLISAPPEVARVVARDIASSWRTTRLMEGTSPGSAPVAILPEDLRGVLDASSDLVILHQKNVAKIGRDHPEVRPESIAVVGDLVEDGTVYLDTARDPALVIHSRDRSRPWWLVIGIDRDHGGLSITTLHRISPRKIATRTQRDGMQLIRE